MLLIRSTEYGGTGRKGVRPIIQYPHYLHTKCIHLYYIFTISEVYKYTYEQKRAIQGNRRGASRCRRSCAVTRPAPADQVHELRCPDPSGKEAVEPGFVDGGAGAV